MTDSGAPAGARAKVPWPKPLDPCVLAAVPTKEAHALIDRYAARIDFCIAATQAPIPQDPDEAGAP